MDAGEIHAHSVVPDTQFLRSARSIRQRDRQTWSIVRHADRPQPQLFLQCVRKQHSLGDLPHFRHGAKMTREENFARPESTNFLVISLSAWYRNPDHHG